jgi:hypothetical protein
MLPPVRDVLEKLLRPPSTEANPCFMLHNPALTRPEAPPRFDRKPTEYSYLKTHQMDCRAHLTKKANRKDGRDLPERLRHLVRAAQHVADTHARYAVRF